MKSLDSKVEEQTNQLDSLNMSIFDIARNTSAQLELEHKDVVSLAVSETSYLCFRKSLQSSSSKSGLLTRFNFFLKIR